MKHNLDPATQCAGLREMAARSPREGERASVEALLDSPHLSVQHTAAQVLAIWGAPEAIAPLVAWARRTFERGDLTSERLAWDCLAPLVGAADVDWIWDEILRRQGMAARGQMLELVREVFSRFPGEALEAKVARECESADEQNARFALVVLGQVPFPSRPTLAARLRDRVSEANRPYLAFVEAEPRSSSPRPRRELPLERRLRERDR